MAERRGNRGWAALVALAVSALSLGCPVVELEREMRPLRSLALVQGELRPSNWAGAPLVLILSREASDGSRHDVDHQTLLEPGLFYFYARRGGPRSISRITGLLEPFDPTRTERGAVWERSY